MVFYTQNCLNLVSFSVVTDFKLHEPVWNLHETVMYVVWPSVCVFLTVMYVVWPSVCVFLTVMCVVWPSVCVFLTVMCVVWPSVCVFLTVMCVVWPSVCVPNKLLTLLFSDDWSARDCNIKAPPLRMTTPREEATWEPNKPESQPSPQSHWRLCSVRGPRTSRGPEAQSGLKVHRDPGTEPGSASHPRRRSWGLGFVRLCSAAAPDSIWKKKTTTPQISLFIRKSSIRIYEFECEVNFELSLWVGGGGSRWMTDWRQVAQQTQ